MHNRIIAPCLCNLDSKAAVGWWKHKRPRASAPPSLSGRFLRVEERTVERKRGKEPFLREPSRRRDRIFLSGVQRCWTANVCAAPLPTYGRYPATSTLPLLLHEGVSHSLLSTDNTAMTHTNSTPQTICCAAAATVVPGQGLDAKNNVRVLYRVTEGSGRHTAAR